MFCREVSMDMLRRGQRSWSRIVVAVGLGAVALTGCHLVFPYDDPATTDAAADHGPTDAPGRPDGTAKPDTRAPEGGTTPPMCGNGVVDKTESCDLDPRVASRLPDAPCRPDCTLPRCGDGTIDQDEECDDGNRSDGDDCTKACTVPSWSGVAAHPRQLHFGAAPVGCGVKVTRTVYIYPTAVSSIPSMSVQAGLMGCDADLSGAPKVLLASTNPLRFKYDVTFAPTTTGDKVCALAMQTTAGKLYIPVTARAVARSTVTDTFYQRPKPQVDGLVVLDTDSSMAAHQGTVAAGASDVAGKLTGGLADWHLGVLQMQQNASNESALRGSPAYLDASTKNLETELKTRLKPTTASSSGTRKPYDLVERALSPPENSTVGGGCTGCNAPHACHASRCRGANWGFRRPGAHLEVLVISNADDQSGSGAAAIVDRLRALVNPLLGTSVRVSGMLGIQPCSGGDHDKVHKAVISGTGGARDSLCVAAGNQADGLRAFGSRLIAGRTRFPLTRPVASGKPAVKVNDKVVTTGWTYDKDSNAVSFTNAPAGASIVAVTYTSNCSMDLPP